MNESKNIGFSMYSVSNFMSNKFSMWLWNMHFDLGFVLNCIFCNMIFNPIRTVGSQSMQISFSSLCNMSPDSSFTSIEQIKTTKNIKNLKSEYALWLSPSNGLECLQTIKICSLVNDTVALWQVQFYNSLLHKALLRLLMIERIKLHLRYQSSQ